MSEIKPNENKTKYGVLFTLVLAVSLFLLTLIQNKYFRDSTSNRLAIVETNNNQEKEISVQVKPVKQPPNTKNNLLNHIKNNDLVEKPSDLIKIDKAKLIAWVNNNDYSKARHYLIKKASLAVDENDNAFLGEVMQLLGRVSATEGDLASTEVYLFEALDIFEQSQNQQQIADTQLLIGRMYAKRREIAKRAGFAYDDLLVARYYLNKGRTYLAKEILDSSISENLKLGRSGAVASAYKSLASFYNSQQNHNDARDALVEASRHYADSGQDKQAQQLISQLKDKQVSLEIIQNLESEIRSKLKRYDSQITLARQARDYMKLYSLYKSKGEAGRAWEFRVKASEILSRSDKRDMYFRMPDVMAVLYDSNSNFDKAEDYYEKAREYYLDQNNIDSYNHVVGLEQILN